MNRYVIRGGQAGFERLQQLAQLRLPDTLQLFDRVGLAEGWHCVDLGSGSGDITAAIAERVGPSGAVLGIDMDATKIALARATVADRQLANAAFETMDLSHWTASAEYDLVYCGLVLQHLADPSDLIRRMWSAVRPGGVLVVEDADFDGMFCQPPDAAFDFYADTYRAVLRKRGGDPAIGRKLPALFRAAGIDDPQVKLVQRADTIGPGKTIALSTLEATAEAIVAEGVATRSEVDDAIGRLAAYSADPTTLIGDPRIFQVWATAPGTD